MSTGELAVTLEYLVSYKIGICSQVGPTHNRQ